MLGEVLDELEEGHASTQIKFLLAGQILGRPFSRGENPFQDFSIVMTLRNHFMHLKHRDSFVDLGG
ncbi:MAG TPA: hypothetical protein VGA17_07825, partial [Nitrospiraceae bacterium]